MEVMETDPTVVTLNVVLVQAMISYGKVQIFTPFLLKLSTK
jgi:hypothetical protein